MLENDMIQNPNFQRHWVNVLPNVPPKVGICLCICMALPEILMVSGILLLAYKDFRS